MKQKQCKYCKGTGRELLKDATNKQTKFMGVVWGGREINRPCRKCNGTGWRMR